MPVTGSAGYFTNSPSPPTNQEPGQTAHTSTAQSHHQTTSAHEPKQHDTSERLSGDNRTISGDTRTITGDARSSADARTISGDTRTSERGFGDVRTFAKQHEVVDRLTGDPRTLDTAGFITQIEQNLVQALDGDTAIHSKTFPDNSDILVISRNQFDGLNQRLDQLNRRVLSLESSLASDIRLILQLVQGRDSNISTSLTSKPIKEVSIVKTTTKSELIMQ